jgi:hypothetical protein
MKDLTSMHYGSELTHVCGYMRALDLTWVRKELFLGTLHSKICRRCLWKGIISSLWVHADARLMRVRKILFLEVLHSKT